jgi:predicted amidohydrolase
VNDLRLIIQQTAPLLDEAEANRRDVFARVKASAGADLVAFPELALSGYALRSRFRRTAGPAGEHPLPGLAAGDPPVALSHPERGHDELVYNAGVILEGSRVLARHRKVYLPTYGPFEEGRFFAPGREPPPVVRLPCGWRVGLLVCEDFWHPALLYLLALQGAELILVLSAAVGRGDPGGDSAGNPDSTHPLFASARTWELLARTAAVQYGLFVALVNRVGVEEGLTFAGGSFVVAPGGEILDRAPQGEAVSLPVRLARLALRKGRTPFSHLRDEDPAYLLRALQRLTSAAG